MTHTRKHTHRRPQTPDNRVRSLKLFQAAREQESSTKNNNGTMHLIVSQAIRIFTASLSCLSSSTIAIMILISDTGLQSPYSRIIFGLSIGDILQSGGIIISPFTVPSDTPDAPWARGNVETCEATGFFLFIGGNIVPFYTVFLSYYFLKRVKDKVTPKEFTRKYELVIHLITWLYTIIAGFVGLARDNFNPSGEGSVCIMMDNPKSCSTDPETYGQCIRGKNAPKDSIFTVVLPLVLSCFAIIVNLVRLTIHVYFEEKMLQKSRQSDSAGAEIDDSNGCCRRHSRHQEIETEPPSDQENLTPQNQAKSLAMQSLGQSSLYICACILVNFFPIVAYIFAAIGKPRPDFVHWGVSLFWPLGGFFNILIYTRPKVTKMRRVYPELSHFSWFVLFLVIVVSGGEVPEIDLGSNEC